MYTYYNITKNEYTGAREIDAYEIRVAFTGDIQVEAVEGYKPPTVVFETEETEDDGFSEYAEFKLEHLLTFIDNGTSAVIAVTMYIIPLIIIGMLTILVGFSLFSETTFVRMFCEHVIDPVYIVTFGHLHVGELSLRKSAWSLVAGYIGCILVYDGNLLRLLVWSMNFVDAFSKLMRGA